MLYRQRVVELLAPHCDIVARLKAVPVSARVRGIYFRALLDELSRRGLRAAYETVIHETDRSAFMLYPTSDYLVWLAFAGSLVASPAEVHRGMHELHRGHSVYFGQSLLGRSLLRLISRDPVRQLHQAIQSKRAVTNYGRWYMLDEGPNHATIRLEDEYVWIESALLGGALGGLEACGIRPTCETKLRDPYNGDLAFRW
ncbi:MAG: DUF2378 family protein [Polyangiaceae bacterium]|nr:DUF2378 family protein [Polyangiaceae bacterium]